LSAQRTSQVYAQLPAHKDIEVLQQGQFVKYDYAKGLVDFDGKGEWMLVYNEIKLYRDFQDDCEFALIKDNYKARVYSPFGGQKYPGEVEVGINGVLNGEDWAMSDIGMQKQSRYYAGRGAYDANHKEIATNGTFIKDGKVYLGNDPDDLENAQYLGEFDKVTTKPDYYEMHYNEDPFRIYGLDKELKMPDGTAMVPRVLKTNVGDIFTTNTVDLAVNDANMQVGKLLTPTEPTGNTVVPTANCKPGILKLATGNEAMLWEIVKIYTMPDHQPGVKIMRVQ